MFEWLFGKSFMAERDIPDLSGKVILVTGGNTGLGKATCLELAKHNPKEVFLAARTQSKADDAIAEIKQAVPSATISFLHLDLTSFKSIKQAVDDFNARSQRLDVLLNNAGIMATPYSLTAEGYEIQLGTNHMGHALLTKLLLPTLTRTAEESGADVRVINLSSAGHQLAPTGGILFDQAAAEKYNTWTRYGSAKLANILHARALGKRYPQLTCAALHPGVIQTDLFASYQSTSFLTRWGLWAFGAWVLKTPEQGAWNQLWACTAEKSEVRKSVFFNPVGKASGGTKYARDEGLAEKLWEWTEKELERHGY